MLHFTMEVKQEEDTAPYLAKNILDYVAHTCFKEYGPLAETQVSYEQAQRWVEKVCRQKLCYRKFATDSDRLQEFMKVREFVKDVLKEKMFVFVLKTPKKPKK